MSFGVDDKSNVLVSGGTREFGCNLPHRHLSGARKSHIKGLVFTYI